MGKRLTLDNHLLDTLAATGPAARDIVEQIRARRRRGRPQSAEANYRRLQLWWNAFRRLNGELTAEQAAQKFLRQRGRDIERELNLKRDTVQSLRNAIARGGKENERVRRRRRASWQIVLGGLAGGFLVTDPNEAVLLRAAVRAAYLGES